MSGERGSILCEQAYAQGKMLDHSGWSCLPRKITPSDVDFAFDNGGRMILCELSSRAEEWRELQYGQRLLYQNLVRDTSHAAALCRHAVDKHSAIDTCASVASFQLMFSFSGEFFVSRVYTGRAWRRFVERWFESPGAVMRLVMGESETKQIGSLK